MSVINGGFFLCMTSISLEAFKFFFSMIVSDLMSSLTFAGVKTLESSIKEINPVLYDDKVKLENCFNKPVQ